MKALSKFWNNFKDDFKKRKKILFIKTILGLVISIVIHFILGFLTLYISLGGLSSWPDFLMRLTAILIMIIWIINGIFGIIAGAGLICLLIALGYNEFRKFSKRR